MILCRSPDFMFGWVPGPDTRGTANIIYSSLSTIWLCTWTCLCLNVPSRETCGWRFLGYKFRWQLFAVLFPEVLVATAAEQWMSAKQSVSAFNDLGHDQWTIRHGFFTDMGGVMLAPRDCDEFPIDSSQLAYLVRHRYLPIPRIDLSDIRAVNKADGLARAVTLGQMLWFTIYCIGRAASHLSLTPLELETLAFILCTIHTFFFWYHKPLDPVRSIVLPLDLPLEQLSIPGLDLSSYRRTPLDILIPPTDPRSLISPFWFGFKCPLNTIPNSASNPPEGVGWPLTIYLILFQVVYYGLHIGIGWLLPFPTTAEFYLWEGASIVDAGLIGIFLLALPIGNHFAPWIGTVMFHCEASTVLEAAAMLPTWAKLLIHAPFVFIYLVARAIGLTSAGTSLRALPTGAFQEVS
ncbi:hypothetical protein HD806DRAFT_525570 [Xylariaceae sp. AK1471]|nr:hypothetical protein HD806DRAFT_525570 [Xylariaceae sp. AK1471]